MTVVATKDILEQYGRYWVTSEGPNVTIKTAFLIDYTAVIVFDAAWSLCRHFISVVIPC